MSVTVNITESGPYTANGVKKSFDRTFYVAAVSEILVFSRINSGSPWSPVLSGWTATKIGQQAGLVTFTVAPAGGEIFLQRKTALTQPAAYASKAPVTPVIVEASLDRQVRMVQDLARELGAVAEDVEALKAKPPTESDGGAKIFASFSDLRGYAGAMTVGEVVNCEGHWFEVAPGGVVDSDIETSGGYLLYLLPGPDGYYEMAGLGLAFGALGDDFSVPFKRLVDRVRLTNWRPKIRMVPQRMRFAFGVAIVLDAYVETVEIDLNGGTIHLFDPVSGTDCLSFQITSAATGARIIVRNGEFVSRISHADVDWLALPVTPNAIGAPIVSIPTHGYAISVANDATNNAGDPVTGSDYRQIEVTDVTIRHHNQAAGVGAWIGGVRGLRVFQPCVTRTVFLSKPQNWDKAQPLADKRYFGLGGFVFEDCYDPQLDSCRSASPTPYGFLFRSTWDPEGNFGIEGGMMRNCGAASVPYCAIRVVHTHPRYNEVGVPSIPGHGMLAEPGFSFTGGHIKGAKYGFRLENAGQVRISFVDFAGTDPLAGTDTNFDPFVAIDLIKCANVHIFGNSREELGEAKGSLAEASRFIRIDEHSRDIYVGDMSLITPGVGIETAQTSNTLHISNVTFNGATYNFASTYVEPRRDILITGTCIPTIDGVQTATGTCTLTVDNVETDAPLTGVIRVHHEGDMVRGSGRIVLSGANTLTGVVRIASDLLPVSADGYGVAGVSEFTGMAGLTGGLFAFVAPGGTIALQVAGPTGSTGMTASNLTAATVIRFSFSYKVSARPGARWITEFGT